MRTARRSKFGAVHTTVDGIRFDSKAEAHRYGVLRMLERAGKIAELELQPRFPCRINGRLVCTYVGDFAYMRGGQRVIEDVKGVETREFKTKRNLVEALHGVTITVIPA